MTDTTRPVRDQAADLRDAQVDVKRRLDTSRARHSVNGTVAIRWEHADLLLTLIAQRQVSEIEQIGLGQIADRFNEVRAERDALRATVARVRALAESWDNLRDRTHLDRDYVTSRLLRALDGATQDAPRPEKPLPCKWWTCGACISYRRCIVEFPRRQDAAAQGAPGVPQTGDPS